MFEEKKQKYENCILNIQKYERFFLIIIAIFLLRLSFYEFDVVAGF